MFCIGGWSLSGLTFLPLCPAPMYIDPLRGALSKTHKTALTLGGCRVHVCVGGGGLSWSLVSLTKSACVWGGGEGAGLSPPSPLSMLLPPPPAPFGGVYVV